MRENEIRKLLAEIGAEEGDFIEISKDGSTYRGMLMPRHAFSKSDVIIKLKNGYNIGMVIDDNTMIKLIRKGGMKQKKKQSVAHEATKPCISLIETGGTIASYIDYATGAVRPASTYEEIASFVPEIFDLCNLKEKIIFQKFSEDITPSDWTKIAEGAADELNEGAEGVVISHGTDTMGYTAAALSFMLKNLRGAVVLTGSQRSSDRPSSDAFRNLLAAAKVATSDLGEVAVVMHGVSSSGQCFIHRGTRVRKMHSSRRDAFRSIDGRPLGFVDSKVHLFPSYIKKKADGKVIADTMLNANVSLIYFHPGLGREDFMRMAEGKDGVVIAGTGMGHVGGDIILAVKEIVRDGVTVVMTTQCIWGRVNMNVYATGRKLMEAGVISGEDMLPETALVKLMWVLAHFEDNDIKNEQKKYMV